MFKNIFNRRKTKVPVANPFDENVNLEDYYSFKVNTNERITITCNFKCQSSIDATTRGSVTNFIETGLQQMGIDVFPAATFAHSDKQIFINYSFDMETLVLNIEIRKVS